MSKGWECPKCGSCYATWVFECPKCSANIKIITTSDTGGIKETKIIKDIKNEQ